jgi:hypothetical protein
MVTPARQTLRKASMSKKMMLLALAAVSAAMVAMPAAASATYNHLHGTPAFTWHGPAGSWSTVGGETFKCKTTSGQGAFNTTTTGSMDLSFHGCSTTVFGFTFSCTTEGQPTGTIVTAPLEFDLIRIDGGGNGIRLKPTAPSTAVAHFGCAGVQKTLGGSIIGTLTSPGCDVQSNTATVDFNVSQHGVQEHRKWTGNDYNLISNGVMQAWDTHATIVFSSAQTVTCT